jgi:hypothetical protein
VPKADCSSDGRSTRTRPRERGPVVAAEWPCPSELEHYYRWHLPLSEDGLDLPGTSSSATAEAAQEGAVRGGLIQALITLASSYRRLSMVTEEWASARAREAEVLLRRVVVPILDVLKEWADEHPELGAGHYESSWELAAGEGLERIERPHQASFDAVEHQAVGHAAGEATAGRIGEVLRAGYRWRGRGLRPALARLKASRDHDDGIP